jgi:sodium-dependent dicarboxylate transporter 2/3/5
MSLRARISLDKNKQEHLPRILELLLGAFLFIIPLLLPAPAGMPVEAWRVMAVFLLMATWWMTEAIPTAATALVPLAAFPLLGVATIEEAAAPYANPLVYMMLGGFMIGLAMQKSNLHRRIALSVLKVSGHRPDTLVGGFMLATAVLSMWVSNTATAAMMMPIGMSVIGLLDNDENLQSRGKDAKNLPVSLLLGIAFGAGIGGIGTLIGTPPNAVLAGFLSDHTSIEIGFAQWMLIGVPTSIILLFAAWIILTKIVFPAGSGRLTGVRSLLKAERKALGKISTAEKRVAIVFLLAAISWTTRPLLIDIFPDLAITDAGIAMIAALALFITPEDHRYHTCLLDWASTRDLPWNVMVLIGGGLSLGAMVQSSGLAEWVGGMLANLDTYPVIVIAMSASLLAMLVSHITSNTATAATMVPLSVSLAATIGAEPLMLAVPVAMACSCAFMMPVATPPNAIVFGSDMLRVSQMARSGALIGLVALPVIALMTFTLGKWIFG